MCFATRWCAVSLQSNKLKFINDKNPIDGVCVATFKLIKAGLKINTN